MAEYRNLNTYGMPGGFNITSGEPIDSRMIVNEISQILEEGNWTDVKPYNGLIVSSKDGQVRVCINSKDYTNPESWLEISGGGNVVVNVYEEAIPLATEDTIGQIIYVKTTSNYPSSGGEEYTSGPYIVTGNGTLMKIGTTTASGDLSSDVANLKSQVSILEGKVTNIESEDGGYKNKIESISVAGQDVAPIEKKVSITFDEEIIDDSSSENAPQTKVVAAKLKELKQQISTIPKFKIEVAEATPETGIPNVPEPDSSTIYLVLITEGDVNNLYTEWIYINETWEKLGEQTVDIDLSNYATKSYVDQAKTEAISTSNLYTDSEVNTKIIAMTEEEIISAIESAELP